MTLFVRSTSNAPFTTRRTERTVAHFAANSASRHALGVSGMSVRWTELSSPGKRSSHSSSQVNTKMGASHVVRRWNRMSRTVRAARRRSVSPSQYKASLRMSK